MTTPETQGIRMATSMIAMTSRTLLVMQMAIQGRRGVSVGNERAAAHRTRALRLEPLPQTRATKQLTSIPEFITRGNAEIPMEDVRARKLAARIDVQLLETNGAIRRALLEICFGDTLKPMRGGGINEKKSFRRNELANLVSISSSNRR